MSSRTIALSHSATFSHGSTTDILGLQLGANFNAILELKPKVGDGMKG
jgi:hypothetical protein